MKTSSSPAKAAALLAAVVLAACSTATVAPPPTAVQPGAPGEASRPVAAAAAADRAEPRHTAADVRFMQGMIAHHRQALEMAVLAPARSGRDDVRLLARRIEVSQGDEIRMMERWLAERGEAAVAGDAHHHHGAGSPHASMPGMISAEEMARLAAATGAEFDRLLLELMIRHHQGAVEMVTELFTRRGAGQDAEIFQLASDIADDQQIEIARMRGMLGSLTLQ